MHTRKFQFRTLNSTKHSPQALVFLKDLTVKLGWSRKYSYLHYGKCFGLDPTHFNTHQEFQFSLILSFKSLAFETPSSTPLAFMDLLWGLFIFSPFAQSECWISISKPNSHKCKKYTHISDQQRNVVYRFGVHTFFSYLATQPVVLSAQNYLCYFNLYNNNYYIIHIIY